MVKSYIERADALAARTSFPALAQWVIDQGVAIQQIPAPTFQEARRAAHVAEQFRQLKLAQVESDDVANVYGLMPGARDDIPGILISAHTDTIFGEDADLTTRTGDGVLYGPGLGDNSMGVAGMLGLARSLRQLQIMPACNLWFAATTREEGLGDLGGMKAAFARLKNDVASVINLEGLAFGHVYHAGIAVRRLHVSATTPGGHSWLHYGRPSAVHSILDLGARLIRLQPPQTPRTTYNIGMVEGGDAINAIASRASLWLDMRSEERAALAALEDQVRAQINETTAPDLNLSVEVVGDRPAGQISTEHPLVQGALAALAAVGIRGTLETGSTDANVPLAEGCPAVTIGITRGGNAHRLDEYIETAPVALGLRQLVILTLAACEAQASQQPAR